MKIVHGLVVSLLAFGFGSIAKADTVIYGMNYGGGGVQIYDANTGASMGVIDTTEMQSGNGRGVVVVGNTMYYTLANSGTVYAYDLSTNTDLGMQFNVAGASGLATMAFDGTNLYLGDYSGTNNVYKYNLSGTLLQTLTLGSCTDYCDGLEFANGHLVSNEFDGGYGGAQTYDMYDMSGNLTQAGLIKTANFGGETGIAFDGTDYWVSEIYNHKFAEYDASGNFVQEVTLQNFAGLGFEDLSANYQVVLGGGTGVPEPSSVAGLASLGLLALGAIRRRRVS